MGRTHIHRPTASDPPRLTPEPCKNLLPPAAEEGRHHPRLRSDISTASPGLCSRAGEPPQGSLPTGPSGFQPPQHTTTLWGSGQSILAKHVAPTCAVSGAGSPGATTPSSSDVLGWPRITPQYGPGVLELSPIALPLIRSLHRARHTGGTWFP